MDDTIQQYMTPEVITLNSDQPLSPPDPKILRPVTDEEIRNWYKEEQRIRKNANNLQNQNQMNTRDTNQSQNQERRSTEETPKEYKRILIVGDSHTRETDSILKRYVPKQCSVKTICKPGFQLDQIVNLIIPEKIGPDTLTCVIVGTNDVFKTKWEKIENSLANLMLKLKDHTILFVLTPPRFDVKKINRHIANLNTRIKYYLAKHKNCTLLDTHNFLHIDKYNRDLVHLNLKGKNTLCYRIVKRMFGKVTQQTYSTYYTQYTRTQRSYLQPQYMHRHQYKHYNQNDDTYRRQARNQTVTFSDNINDTNNLHHKNVSTKTGQQTTQPYNNQSAPRQHHQNTNTNPLAHTQTRVQPRPPSYRDALMKNNRQHNIQYMQSHSQHIQLSNRFAPLQSRPYFQTQLTTLV
uniref:SGNH hydrolase-type esterase domain-containing protein n=1 Tax=Cacopsylla melanoneura TaxID=428564 RepID=A0A8D8UG21_9HEMI